MIEWTIATVLRSEIFDSVIVSTDDQEIAEVASKAGAEVPFMRPHELSDDYATTSVVMLHGVRELQQQGRQFDSLFCVYATNPFLSENSLCEGARLMNDESIPAAYTVTSCRYPIFRARKVNEKGALEMIWPEYLKTRTQDLPETFQDAAQFYCAKMDRYLREKIFGMEGARPIILPHYQVQDIDNEEDWIYAEKLFQIRNLSTPDQLALG